MTCFLKHLDSLLKAAGIQRTVENAAEIQEEIRRIIGVKSHDCSDIWKELKVWLGNEEKKKILEKQLRKYAEV
jgi:cell division protein FtsX